MERSRIHRYDYTPKRTEAADHNRSASALRKLVLFGSITGITLFGAAETGVFHIEDAPVRVWRGIRSIDIPSERDYQGPGKLYDTPVEPQVLKQFLTEDFGNGEIPVRSEPSAGGDLVGITLRTYLVNGKEWWGATYPGDSAVGHSEGPDGEPYGIWFKADAVPLFQRTQSGEYVPVGVARGAYIAENFLTLPVETPR